MTDFRYLYVVLYQCNLYWRMDTDFKVCVWFSSSLYIIKLLVDGFINWIWGRWQILPRFACEKVLFHSKHTQICNCNTYSKMGQSYGNKSSPRQQHTPMGTCKKNSPLTLPNYMSCDVVFSKGFKDFFQLTHCGLVKLHGDGSRSTLNLITAWCLIAPIHYLNPCWLNKVRGIHQRGISQLQEWMFLLTYWGQTKMATIFHITILNAFSWNENVWILIKISLNFVPRDPVENIPQLV